MCLSLLLHCSISWPERCVVLLLQVGVDDPDQWWQGRPALLPVLSGQGDDLVLVQQALCQAPDKHPTRIHAHTCTCIHVHAHVYYMRMYMHMFITCRRTCTCLLHTHVHAHAHAHVINHHRWSSLCIMAHPNIMQAWLYHVRVELALQKPLITHERRMVQLPNLEDRLFYERQ